MSIGDGVVFAATTLGAARGSTATISFGAPIDRLSVRLGDAALTPVPRDAQSYSGALPADLVHPSQLSVDYGYHNDQATVDIETELVLVALGPTIASTTVRPKGGRLSVRVGCPAPLARRCEGSLTL